MAAQGAFQTPVTLLPNTLFDVEQINTIPAYTHSNTSSTPVILPPRLVILKQNCLADEKYMRNGITQTAKVVVKNSPFIIQLGLAGPGFYSKEAANVIYSQVDLHQFIYDAKLFYDTDEDDKKEVDFVKLKPLEFKAQVNENGTQITMEVRIKVLTSQLEDMFFRVKVRALDPRTKREVSTSLTVMTAPIKVVSKPEQILKKKKDSKKRTLNDMMAETLNRIEQQQQDQQQLLNKINGEIVSGDECGSDNTPSTPSQSSDDSPSVKRPEKMIKLEKGCELENAVQTLLACVDKVPPEIQAEKMRKIIRDLNITRESVSELHDLFWAEGLQRALGDLSEQDERVASVKRDVVCDCPDCPHKKELERVEDFYREVFSMHNS